jgi:predicted small secreted protein
MLGPAGPSHASPGQAIARIVPRHPHAGANIMARHLLTVALIAGSFALSGCNTVRGLGKDLGSAGAALETVN